MAENTKLLRHAGVTLHLPSKVAALIVYAQGIVTRMTRRRASP